MWRIERELFGGKYPKNCKNQLCIRIAEHKDTKGRWWCVEHYPEHKVGGTD